MWVLESVWRIPRSLLAGEQFPPREPAPPPLEGWTPLEERPPIPADQSSHTPAEQPPSPGQPSSSPQEEDEDAEPAGPRRRQSETEVTHQHQRESGGASASEEGSPGAMPQPSASEDEGNTESEGDVLQREDASGSEAVPLLPTEDTSSPSETPGLPRETGMRRLSAQNADKSCASQQKSGLAGEVQQELPHLVADGETRKDGDEVAEEGERGSHPDEQRRSRVLAWLEEQELPWHIRDGPNSAPASPLPDPGSGPGQSRVRALRRALLEQPSPFSPRVARSQRVAAAAPAPRQEMDPLLQRQGAQAGAVRAPEPRPTEDKAVQIDADLDRGSHPQLMQDLQAFFNDRFSRQASPVAGEVLQAQAAPCTVKPPRTPGPAPVTDPGVQEVHRVGEALEPGMQEARHGYGQEQGHGDQPRPCSGPRSHTQAVNGDAQTQGQGHDRNCVGPAPHRTRDQGVEDKCLECCVYYSVRCCECAIL